MHGTPFRGISARQDTNLELDAGIITVPIKCDNNSSGLSRDKLVNRNEQLDERLLGKGLVLERLGCLAHGIGPGNGVVTKANVVDNTRQPAGQLRQAFASRVLLR